MSEVKYETINLENLEQYSTFETTEEMDEKIYEYIDQLRADERPESTIEVLRFLGRSSLRIPGVSFAKYETIAQKVGVSVSTVKRAMKTLSDYGMIERIPTVKKWTGRSQKKSVNIIILKSVTPQADTSAEVAETTDGKALEDDKTTEPLNNNHFNNNYILETAKAVKNAIPTPIYNNLRPFFSGKDLQRITGVILRAKTSKVRLENHKQAFADLFIDVIRRYKAGKLKNLDGYLFMAVRRLSRQLFLTGV